MEHTYLRYECADSFGLTVASASSKAPPSNAILGILAVADEQHKKSNVLLLTTTGSCVTGFHLKQAQPVVKIGHRESSGIGTGRALNSDEVVCLDVIRVETGNKAATGWVDGSIRIFDLYDDDEISSQKLAHSLLNDERNELLQREPLLLNGHNGSPVRTVVFDHFTKTRLASGGSDGAVVLWDIVAETGLFRLLGHRGAITDISFLHLPQGKFDGLISSSLDGLVKIWDLNAQCCTQTIASHRGEVWASTCRPVIRAQENDEEERWRLITGGNDGQVRVWMVEPAQSRSISTSTSDVKEQKDVMVIEEEVIGRKAVSPVTKSNPDDVCHFIGTLLPPPNVSVSNEKLACIHFHPSGRFVGVLHANSKNVDIYLIRGVQESQKKRQRRLRRRQEKQKKKGGDGAVQTKSSGQKRGILDDPESSDDEDKEPSTIADELMDPELMKASDEFEYLATARCSHKVRGFLFVPNKEKGELTRIVCALTTNALETHCLVRKEQEGDKALSFVLAEKLSTMDVYGHPTGIRSIAISSDDRLACSVSKNVTKIWNVASRTCIQSLSPAVESTGGRKGKSSSYGLCAAFLPGNTHVAVGTREGHLLLIDIAAGEVVYTEENAHDGAIWSIDIRRSTPADSAMAVVTGSADKSVKFWTIEAQDDNDSDGEGNEDYGSLPQFVQTRTLQMSDDVIAVGYSKGLEATKRMVFVSTLDCTIKVFFDDSLKMFLSLYGHKLPALAVDSSDDDVLLASGGADKTIKIWGLDFGDTHRTLHGHEDSITDIKFVKRTHNFFSSSKDGTVRYWDGDRHEQILLLNGHCAEVNCMAVSRTGAFILSGGMDRQVRVWERTKDIVFLEEERERELERIFDRVGNKDERGTAGILDGSKRGEDDDEDVVRDDEPQSEVAVRKSVLSVSSGDRIMEALELADKETKDKALFVRTHGSEKNRPPNLLMLGHTPAAYILWVLRTIKSADLEQSLIVLPLGHIERLMFYIIVLLKKGQGIELCSRVAIFLIKTHQNQIVANSSMAPPLRELRRLIRMRLAETRDVVGFDLAALKLISKVANDRKQSFLMSEHAQPKDIWAGLGLGSDVAAALEGR